MVETITANKSQKILDTLKRNVESFRKMLDIAEDDLTKQNILRAIILFSCSGIDAIVKQLVLETLEPIIERDEGAQEQLKKFTERELKNNTNYSLLADLFTARNSRKALIELLKQDLTFNSLQSSEQLFRVASYFNINTDKLLYGTSKSILNEVFSTRNIIVHQMDLALDKSDVEYYQHEIEEVNKYYNAIITVSQNFINEANLILSKNVSNSYTPFVSIENGALVIRNI